MRTTIELNDEVFRAAKQRAAEEGRPLRELVEEAQRAHLAGRPAQGARYRLHWRSERGRLLPDVRLDDRDALFDLMDERG